MPILSQNTFEFFSHSPEQTRRVGIRLGSLLKPGHIVCLEGDLGSGKTTLVQGIAQGWGSADRVSSPTFVIMNDYRHPNGQHLYHADAYRLSDSPEDVAILDLPNLLVNGILVLEWAERIKSNLPEENLWIQMRWITEERRNLTIIPQGEPYQELAKNLKILVFGAF